MPPPPLIVGAGLFILLIFLIPRDNSIRRGNEREGELVARGY